MLVIQVAGVPSLFMIFNGTQELQNLPHNSVDSHQFTAHALNTAWQKKRKKKSITSSQPGTSKAIPVRQRKEKQDALISRVLRRQIFSAAPAIHWQHHYKTFNISVWYKAVIQHRKEKKSHYLWWAAEIQEGRVHMKEKEEEVSISEMPFHMHFLCSECNYIWVIFIALIILFHQPHPVSWCNPSQNAFLDRYYSFSKPAKIIQVAKFPLNKPHSVVPCITETQGHSVC